MTKESLQILYAAGFHPSQLRTRRDLDDMFSVVFNSRDPSHRSLSVHVQFEQRARELYALLLQQIYTDGCPEQFDVTLYAHDSYPSHLQAEPNNYSLGIQEVEQFKYLDVTKLEQLDHLDVVQVKGQMP